MDEREQRLRAVHEKFMRTESEADWRELVDALFPESDYRFEPDYFTRALTLLNPLI
jgi:hypothetical protein